jgi:alkylation response protein AidB-like acyl-CoA dehydrogenase
MGALDATRPLVRIVLDGVRVEGLTGGSDACQAAYRAGLLILSAEAVGGAEAALRATVAYVRERHQFGRPIGSFQAVKHRLADSTVNLEQARSAMFWAACAIDENHFEAELAVHAAKAFCADTYFGCAADMIQLHGGIGFTWDHPAHLFFRRARSIQTLLGDSASHREAVAALTLDAAS